MYNNFETEKNTKAFSYTLLVCLFLLAIALFYKWQITLPKILPVQDLIEVNLGNNNEGTGEIQPLKKGEAAPEIKQVSQKNSGGTLTQHQDIKVDENKNQEAATLVKEDKKNVVHPIEHVAPLPSKPVAVSTPEKALPAPPKLKVPLYKGSNGTGGNGAAEDNGFRSQGYKSGNGDAGSIGGKPDSYGNATGGESGVSVIRGLSGRKPIHFPAMSDEFNENAKIYVDISVDANGAVTDASIARGSTTSNGSLRSIAIQKAKQLKFPPSKNDEEKGTILFNFILRN